MTEPAPFLAVFGNATQLHQIMRDRADELQLSRKEIDRLAGLPENYSSKLLGPQPKRRISLQTLWFLAPALGLSLAVVVDEGALKIVNERGQKRRLKPAILAVPTGCGKVRLVSKRFLRKIAPEGGRARAKNMTPKQRAAHGRRMVRARWKRAKATKQCEGMPAL